MQSTHLLVPKSSPLTVTLPPAVVASFAPPTLDTPLPSYDIICVSDPTTSPDVTASPRLPPTPPPTLHTNDVSDTHAVAAASV